MGEIFQLMYLIFDVYDSLLSPTKEKGHIQRCGLEVVGKRKSITSQYN